MSTFRLAALVCIVVAVSSGLSSLDAAEYPPFDKVIEGFRKVEPPSSEPGSMYTVYVKADTSEMLLELPKNFATKKYFIGLTVASGQVFAGLQAGDFYVHWREYNKRLALIEPNTYIRSGGDAESKDSVNRLFTGQVLLDLPILTLSPQGGPVIDGRSLLVSNASVFFSGAQESGRKSPKEYRTGLRMPSAMGNLQHCTTRSVRPGQ